jgi:tetratricopeptide (TPR) repeat protein
VTKRTNQKSKSQQTGATPVAAGSRRRRGATGRRISTWLLVALLLATVVKVSAEVSLWRAQVAIDSREHVAAGRWLTVARFVVPIPLVGADLGEFYFLSARLNRRLDKFDRVSDELRKARSHGWDVAAVEREQWIALAQTGRFDRVASHIADLLTDAGSDGPEICEAYVAWLLSRFKLPSAHRVIDVWQQDFPESGEPYFQRGRIFSVTQNWTAAVEQYSESLQREPHRTDVRLMRAKAQIQLVRYSEASADLEDVLRAEPGHVEARIAHAQCLLNLGQAEAACRLLEAVVDEHPDSSEALSLLGRIEQKQGHQEAALVALEKAVAIRPIDSDARYALGKTLRALGRDAESKAHFDFVAESTRALLKLGQLTEKLVQKPDDVELRFEVGKLTWEWRSRDVGEQWLRSVLDYDAGHVETHKVLAEHYRDLGDQKRATHHQEMAESKGSRQE